MKDFIELARDAAYELSRRISEGPNWSWLHGFRLLCNVKQWSPRLITTHL